MADRRSKNYYIDGIEGSAVRKLEPQVQPREPERRKSAPTPSVQRRPANDRRWVEEFKYGIFLVSATIVAVGLCYYLLQLRADVRAEKVRIEELQSQLTAQLNANAEYSSGLDSMTDLDEIYRIATGELGMVYSRPGQTVYYSQNSDDYVVQYQNIPEAN